MKHVRPDWFPSVNLIALKAWLRFNIDCERFDRTMPGVWSKWDADCWMPFGMGKSARYAREQADRVRTELCRPGGPGICSDAKNIVDKMTYTQQVRMLEDLEGDGQSQ